MKRLVLTAILGLALAAPAAASAGPQAAPPQKPQAPGQATVKIVNVGHLRKGRAPIYSTVPVVGTVAPFAPHQKVEVTFYLDGRKLLMRKVRVRKGQGDSGVFKAEVLIREDGRYAASAHLPASGSLLGDRTVRKSWKVSFPALGAGDCGRVVKGFKQAMAQLGYVAGGGSCFSGRLGREVLAYRKVNGMSRNTHAGAGAWSNASSAAAAATACATPRPASTPRCRSTSRSSCSPRAAARSRSTRSRPASPRPRR